MMGYKKTPLGHAGGVCMVKNECSNDVFDTLRSARVQCYGFGFTGTVRKFDALDLGSAYVGFGFNASQPFLG